MTYQPIFKNEWPDDVQLRWHKIRSFLSVWCFGDTAHPISRSETQSQTATEFEQLTKVPLSHSIRNWFDILDNHAGDELIVRDVKEVSSLANHISSVEEAATVILMQGEGDIFWTVSDSDLSKEDPAVHAFQKFDDESPALLGTYPSVSSFALQYFCTYNNMGKNRVEAFQLDVTANESVDEVINWFSSHIILADDSMNFCQRCHLFEQENCVAIRGGNRFLFSLFAEPDELELPKKLELAVEEERRSQAEHAALMASIRGKKR